MKKRCEWCGGDPLYVKYHNCEWGTPLHEELKKMPRQGKSG
jgi:DNA-3-methyladenine glycosylase I